MTAFRLRRDGIHWLETDGEIVALDDKSLQYLSANPAGALLWQALARGATREQLVECLLQEFEVGEQIAIRDVDAFLAELTSLDLLEK